VQHGRLKDSRAAMPLEPTPSPTATRSPSQEPLGSAHELLTLPRHRGEHTNPRLTTTKWIVHVLPGLTRPDRCLRDGDRRSRRCLRQRQRNRQATPRARSRGLVASQRRCSPSRSGSTLGPRTGSRGTVARSGCVRRGASRCRTSSGQTVTVDKRPLRHTGREQLASASGREEGKSVLRLGTVNGTTIAAAQVIVQTTATSSATESSSLPARCNVRVEAGRQSCNYTQGPDDRSERQATRRRQLRWRPTRWHRRPRRGS